LIALEVHEIIGESARAADKLHCIHKYIRKYIPK
jgi:hypothetical protein